MSNFDIFSMAVRNLFKRKLRTFLTILGVIIGASAIIIMISLGIALNKSFERTISQMGDLTTITVRDPMGGGRIMMGGSVSPSKNQKKVELNDKSLKEFYKLNGVLAVTPVTSIYMQGKYDRFAINFEVKGIDTSLLNEFGFDIDRGRFFNPNEKLAAVSGKDIIYNFYDPNGRKNVMDRNGKPTIDILDQKLTLSYDWGTIWNDPNDPFSANEKKADLYTIKIVGTLQPSGYEKDYSVFMDIKEVQKIKKDQQKFEQTRNANSGGSRSSNQQNLNNYEMIMIKCTDINVVKDLIKEVENMGLYADSPISYLESMKEFSSGIQIFLGAVGAVSLFVAAIGIANTMVMSIYERTREIGIMKVIGASIKDIRKLFLLEAALIGFLGGLIGVLLSLLISFILNNANFDIFHINYGDENIAVSVIPLWLALSAMGFSATIGLISGYFPARRAMKLGALEAIKTE